MKQTDLGLNLSTKRTRKLKFLDEMNGVVPWADLAMLIAAYAPEGKRGRPPFAAMLRIHFMQQWFGLSDPATGESSNNINIKRIFQTTKLSSLLVVCRLHLFEHEAHIS